MIGVPLYIKICVSIQSTVVYCVPDHVPDPSIVLIVIIVGIIIIIITVLIIIIIITVLISVATIVVPMTGRNTWNL